MEGEVENSLSKKGYIMGKVLQETGRNEIHGSYEKNQALPRETTSVPLRQKVKGNTYQRYPWKMDILKGVPTLMTSIFSLRKEYCYLL